MLRVPQSEEIMLSMGDTLRLLKGIPRPKKCMRCVFFYGRSDLGNYLNCAVHPVGEPDDCPDFEPAKRESFIEKPVTLWDPLLCEACSRPAPTVLVSGSTVLCRQCFEGGNLDNCFEGGGLDSSE